MNRKLTIGLLDAIIASVEPLEWVQKHPGDDGNLSQVAVPDGEGAVAQYRVGRADNPMDPRRTLCDSFDTLFAK